MTDRTKISDRNDLLDKSNKIYYVCSEKEFFNEEKTIKIGQTIYDDEFTKLNFVFSYKSKTSKVLFSQFHYHNRNRKKKSSAKNNNFILPSDIKLFLETIINDKIQIKNKKFFDSLAIQKKTIKFRKLLSKMINSKTNKKFQMASDFTLSHEYVSLIDF